jgi:single-stranded-DNA-specific exonuclease
VPIVGENRVFTFFGLKKLNTNPQPGFRAMLEIANVKKKELTVTDVVFTLAPRINAAGRIESGNKAVEVMLAENTQQAYAGGSHINEQNTSRKELDSGITGEAIHMIRSDEKLLKQKTTVLYQEHWHKGVIGIVASRCIENYYRPTIILTESNGKAAGSARSVKGFDVYEALEQCSDLLEQFGGHKYAAGMTLPLKNIELFQRRFEEVVANSIPEHLLEPEIEIDAEVKLHEINSKFFQVLKQFAPFGPQNMKPVFVARDLKERGYGRLLKDKHLKIDLLDPEKPGVFYPAIGFNMADRYHIIKGKSPFDVAFTIEENEWNGKVSLQLNIKDVKATV